MIITVVSCAYEHNDSQNVYHIIWKNMLYNKFEHATLSKLWLIQGSDNPLTSWACYVSHIMSMLLIMIVC